MTEATAIVHATTVAVEGQGVLIQGPSGSGKSGLALQLMALGARLVADDRTILTRRGAPVIASCPAPLLGLIEARGVGLLRSDALPEAPVALVIDMGTEETVRLPPVRQIAVLDHRLPILQKVNSPHFPAAILQYLSGRNQNLSLPCP